MRGLPFFTNELSGYSAFCSHVRQHISTSSLPAFYWNWGVTKGLTKMFFFFLSLIHG